MRFLKGRPPAPVSPSLAAALSGHDTAVNVVRFSPDGQILAAGCGRTVVLWDVTDLAHPAQRAALTHQGRPGLAGAMGFSPDGRLLATGAKNAVVLWDVAALAHPAQAATVQLSRTGRGGPVLTVRAVAFSPDGQSLAAGSGWSVATQYSSSSRGAIALWDITDLAHPVQTSTRTFGNTAYRGANAEVSAVAFSPDGRLAAAGARRAKVWGLDNTGPGRWARTLTGHQGQVSGVRFRPDVQLLASCGTDKTVRLWEPSCPESGHGRF